MSTVGELTTTRPLSVKVFQRHGIDFCCGGGRSLEEACAARGLAPEALLAEIQAEEAQSSTTPTRWDQEPLGALIQHILRRYHAPLAEDLPRLEFMARKVHRVHADKDPRLLQLAETITALKIELEAHMAKEEQVLFPWIVQGKGVHAGHPIAVMKVEHEDAGAMLAKIQELTDSFVLPAEACNTWRALWQGLEAFDRDLREHVALENNVLFPRALQGD